MAIAVTGCGSSKKSSSSASNGSSSNAPAQTTPPPASTTSSSAPAAGALSLSADPSGALKFDKSSLSAKSGAVTIKMSNPSSLPHGIAIQGNGVDKTGQVVNQGGTSTVSVKLKPGKYTFFCPVPGHKQAGMQGTLTVK